MTRARAYRQSRDLDLSLNATLILLGLTHRRAAKRNPTGEIHEVLDAGEVVVCGNASQVWSWLKS